MAGLIDFKVSIKTPRLKFKTPDSARFWKAVAVTGQKLIRKRTEKDGKDVEGMSFKPYSQSYKEFRESKGRSSKPNLSFTGKMLGGMIASGSNGEATIKLTGEQGLKAFANEEEGREFFGFTAEEADKIFDDVADFIGNQNGFK